MSAWDTQTGGNHYSKLKIQPMQYSLANGLDAAQHTAIKYITRFKDKNGIEDLDKAIHCIEMLKEHYYEDTVARLKVPGDKLMGDWQQDRWDQQRESSGDRYKQALKKRTQTPTEFTD